MWADAWTDSRLALDHKADLAEAAWTPVDLGLRNPGELAGADLWRGDLGVSGRTSGSQRVPQEIDGSEALRISLVDMTATEVSFALAAFDRNVDGSGANDSTRALFLDGADDVVEEVFVSASEGTSFTVDDLTGVAAVIFQAGAEGPGGEFVAGGVRRRFGAGGRRGERLPRREPHCPRLRDRRRLMPRCFIFSLIGA